MTNSSFPLIDCFSGQFPAPWKISSCFYVGFIWLQPLPNKMLQSIPILNPTHLQAASAVWRTGRAQAELEQQQADPCPYQPCPYYCDICLQSTGLSRHIACETACKFMQRLTWMRCSAFCTTSQNQYLNNHCPLVLSPVYAWMSKNTQPRRGLYLKIFLFLVGNGWQTIGLK